MTALPRLIATVGHIGYLRPAPGTWGSLAALPMAWVLFIVGGLPLAVVGAVLAFGAGWWATAEMIRGQSDHDPSEIVIDEVAGQLVALLPLLHAAWRMEIEVTALWPGWIAAFALFRLFDITKPGPVGWADRRGDALGVMLDDVIAGVFAAIGVIALAALWHGMLGL